MRIVQSPEDYELVKGYEGDYTVFLAGGISNCTDWQQAVVDRFTNCIAAKNEAAHKHNPDFDHGRKLTLINPRRSGQIGLLDGDAAEQIAWEHKYLKDVDLVSFWFPCETLCPITLFEYGKCLGLRRNMVVGTHPDYQRKFDVEQQTQLVVKDSKLYDIPMYIGFENFVDGLFKTVLHQMRYKWR